MGEKRLVKSAMVVLTRDLVVTLIPTINWLVGGFNPFENYARQNGNLPQVGVEIKNIWNHQPVT